MNKYTCEFKCNCPKNGLLIAYKLVIETDEIIMVEDLTQFVETQVGFHEEIADKIRQAFPGKQYMVAYHHGVLIETWR